MDLLDEDDIKGSSLTPKAINDLKGASGWMKFIAILGIVGCVFSLLQLFFELSMAMSFGGGAGGYGGIILLIVVVSVVILGVIIWASVLLLQYGNRISKFVESGNSSDLEVAFAKQRMYWMLIGIIAIIGLIYYLWIYATIYL